MSSAYYTELGYNYAVYCRDYDDTVAQKKRECKKNMKIFKFC